MADVRDLFYHGIRQQIRRVLTAMGDKRIEAGLTAFENGASNWSACFFARAYPELQLGVGGNPELQISRALGMGQNVMPMRIVYSLFDNIGRGKTMSKSELNAFVADFVNDVKDPDKLAAINTLLSSLDMTQLSTNTEKPLFTEAACRSV